MSWLARSLANSLILDDHDNDRQDLENDTVSTSSTTSTTITCPSRATHDGYNERNEALPSRREREQERDQNDDEEDELHSRGVREDFTELKETLAKQLWGVASFLAPPPPPDISIGLRGDLERSEMRSADSAEIGGGLTYFGEEEDEGNNVEEGNCPVGITEEVLAFARNIAMHPETWLDFPLDPDEDLGGNCVFCWLIE